MRIAIVLTLAACTHVRPDPVTPPAPPAPQRDVAAPAANACAPVPAPRTVPLPAKAIAIAASWDHACALLETGRVWCWGDNEHEQSGPGRTPTQAPQDMGLEHVTQIALGWSSGCARHADGTTSCWGRKTNWNPDYPQSHIAAPPTTDVVDQVASGHDHTCVLVRGAVDCYGDMGTFATFPAATPAVPGVPPASAIVAGDEHDCAITGGSVVCWGAPWHGSCDQDCERDKQRPVAYAVPGIRDATAIALGTFDACAVRKTGGIACWGTVNGMGAGADAASAIPGITDATQLALGPHHACVLRTGGDIACWGTGYRGELGDGHTEHHGAAPVRVVGIEHATAIAAGLATTCALLRDGRVTCWGINDHDQLGFATPMRSAAPVEACELDGATRLAATEYATCALRRDGTLACWGLGFQRGPHSPKPHELAGATAIVDITSNDDALCALDRAGRVQCWSGFGETPRAPTTPATAIALGRYGLCAADRAGAVTCNDQPVAGVTRATKLAVGDDFACALVDHHVTCWGRNLHAPLTSPLANVADLAAQRTRICARTTDGHVKCAPATSPLADTLLDAAADPWSTAAPGDLWDVTQVVHGRDHDCALRANGRVACWGDNLYGQLGMGAMGLVATPAR